MKTFWEAFGEMAARHGGRIAIDDRGTQVTYAALARKAAAIGGHLRRQGVTAETPVAIEIEKSADYVAALLGCWHAGAAFVPLPPQSLPQERRDHIMRHAGIRHSLTAYDLRDMAEEEKPLPPAPLQPESLAYIIYTSGSTGAPKGVMVEHRGILRFLQAQVGAFGLEAGDRNLFYLSVLFDAAISDIGTTLLAGATLVILPPADLRDGARLLRALHEKGVTHMDVPPSLLKTLPLAQMPASLKTVVIGGEICPPHIVRQWAARQRVVNVYGPTEATVCTSLCLCDAQDWQRPLLGDPLPGVSYHILGDDGHEAQDGELYIGGDCLARGYLQEPALTDEKFIRRDGLRLYRTGDHVRRLPSGGIEFLGRMDRQFKLRGQLVEPDEIEARLLTHPRVMKAAALKRDERLVAFVQCEGAVNEAELRAHAARALPGWMVPQHVAALADWPLTATGKTDMAALRQLPLTMDRRDIVMPRTETEQALWQVWRDILGHDDFGVTDHFFDAGGDSLDVIRLTLAAERAGISFTGNDLAAAGTIARLAEGQGQGDGGLDTAWLKRDVAFDAAFENLLQAAALRPESPLAAPRKVLVTGAAGFLAGYVIRELLAQTTAEIHCLARGQDDAAVRSRVMQNLQRNGPLPAGSAERLVMLRGDLEEEMFGLGAAQWQRLAQDMDAVYHCAARVNMVLPYEDLRAANVQATQDVLRFCLTGRRKHLHYASTLSVFVASDANSGDLREDDRLEGVGHVHGGYAQGKWAAEWMLLGVPRAACRITSYRLGLVTGDTRGGKSSPHDFLAMFARGMAALGMAPEGWDGLEVDVTPVDYAARAMVALSLKGQGDIYHIANSRALTLGGLLAAVERKGRKLLRLPAPRWLAAARQTAAGADETAALLSLCRVEPQSFARNRVMDLFQATGVRFDSSQAQAVMGGDFCPPPDDALIDLYMQDFLGGGCGPLRICVFGPESTGKSTLAQKLGGMDGAAVAEEFAKDYLFARGGEITAQDIPAIARGQARAEAQAEAIARDLLVCDTDLLTTTIWSRWLFGDCPVWIEDAARARQYDLYLLMDVDTPWVADTHRYLPKDRENFLAECKAVLEREGRPYVLLSGSWEAKLAQAKAAIAALRAHA